MKIFFVQFFCVFFGEGNGTPLKYSCLENPMDGGAWWAAIHGVSKSWTWLSDFTFIFHFHALEKEMKTHSSVLARRIPGMGEPVGLPSMGSHRVGHDWSDLAVAVVNNYGPCSQKPFQCVNAISLLCFLDAIKENEYIEWLIVFVKNSFFFSHPFSYFDALWP